MKKSKISMKDIADELAISKTAVSLALGNKAGVGRELRERIFAAAARHGYSIGEKKPTDESRKLLIITPEFTMADRNFYTDIFLGIQKQAQVTGHFTMLIGVTEQMVAEGGLPPALKDHGFDGVLCVGVVPHDYLKLLVGTGLPIIAVDNYYDDMALNAVVTANEEGAFEATRHLIGLGHRAIGFVAPIENSASFYARWEGYRKAMIYSKLPIEEGLSILDPWPIASLCKDPATIRAAVAALPGLPTAFVCGNDDLAMTLIGILRDLGKAVPGELSVTGFDDIEAARFFAPGLTTYRVPRIQLGQESVRFLLSLIADHKREPCVTKRSMHGSLQVRGSTAAPR